MKIIMFVFRLIKSNTLRALLTVTLMWLSKFKNGEKWILRFL